MEMVDRKWKGFTLVELIVVLVVLSIAAFVITPAISLAREVAGSSICKSRLNSWSKAYSQYLMEHNDRYHRGDTKSSRSCRDMWMMALEPYISDKSIMFCPESSGTAQEGGVLPTMAWQLKADSYYDQVRDAGMDKGSYCLNFWVNDADSSGSGTSFFWRNSQASDARNIPVLADGGEYTAGVYDDGKDYLPSSEPIDKNMSAHTFGYRKNINKYLLKRHGNSINVLFMDGSVRSVMLMDLWSLNWHKGYKPLSTDNASWQWPKWIQE